MLIELARVEDARAIAEVHVASWQAAYRGLLPEGYLASLSIAEREARWRRDIESGQAWVLVVRAREGQVLGLAAYGASRDDDAPAQRGELQAIYLHPAHWGQGMGRALCRAALQDLAKKEFTSAGLWVIEGNDRAIRFYERVGFVCEPDSRKAFELGGVSLHELRYRCALPAPHL